MSGKTVTEVGAGGMPDTAGLDGSRVKVAALGWVPFEPICIFWISVVPPSAALFQAIVKVTVPALTKLKPLLPPASIASTLLSPPWITDEGRFTTPLRMNMSMCPSLLKSATAESTTILTTGKNGAGLAASNNFFQGKVEVS